MSPPSRAVGHAPSDTWPDKASRTSFSLLDHAVLASVVSLLARQRISKKNSTTPHPCQSNALSSTDVLQNVLVRLVCHCGTNLLLF